MESIILFSLIVVILLILPVAIIVFYGFAVYHSVSAFSKMVYRSISLTLASSFLTGVITVVLFTPLAYFLSRTKSFALDTLVDLPVSVPHPIIGIGLLLLDSPVTPIGRFLLSIGINFFDTLTGLIAALILVSAPIYIRSIQTYFEGINIDREIYAMGLGLSKFKILWKIIVPTSIRQIVSSCLISVGRAMSEFGSIAIVAFYIISPPFKGTEPASILIYEDYGYYGPEIAVTISALLIIVAIPIMITARIITR
ncbi:sulfate ABC transporter permease [Sulfolobales archaeon HS-7]|nr:sulfate ABC transporter permease [Sulfolobales archaeon HS-7]